MGRTVLGTPIVPPYMALSQVSVPSHCPTWDGWDCPRDSHRPPCPTCPSRPIVPHGTGGTVLGIPMCPVIHGLSYVSVPSHCHTRDGGTVLGIPMCPVIHGLSHVSVPSHCPTWDRRDSPRDSHVSRHTWLVLCVRPVPLSHMGQEGLS